MAHFGIMSELVINFARSLPHEKQSFTAEDAEYAQRVQ